GDDGFACVNLVMAAPLGVSASSTPTDPRDVPRPSSGESVFIGEARFRASQVRTTPGVAMFIVAVHDIAEPGSVWGAVRELVEATVGTHSTNEYFEVESQNALGLPS